MNRIDWSKLLLRNQLCLSGSYFTKKNEVKISKIKSMLSRSFIFSFLIQLRTKHNRFISRLAGFFLFYLYKSDIHCDALINEEIFFPHPMGIVIGQKASLKGQLIVFDHTTFGKKYPGTRDGMPSLSGRGLIGSGVKILGDISLTENYVVAANSVCTKSLKNQTFIHNKIIDGVYFDNTA